MALTRTNTIKRIAVKWDYEVDHPRKIVIFGETVISDSTNGIVAEREITKIIYEGDVNGVITQITSIDAAAGAMVQSIYNACWPA